MKEKAGKAMDKIKDTLTGQETVSPNQVVRVRRQSKGKANRIAQLGTLVLWPRLCDSKET